MLATCPRVHQFPGTVPALLAWANGECERLPGFVTSTSAEATTLLQTLEGAVAARNAPAVRMAAHRLHAVLAHFGVPQLLASAALLEDLASSDDLGPAVGVVDELGALLPAFWAYLTRKPWLR